MAGKRFSENRRDNDINGGIAISKQVLIFSVIAIVITFAVHAGQRIASASRETRSTDRYVPSNELERPSGIAWTIEIINNDGNYKGQNSLALDDDG
jgi:hypothetical protein